MSKITKNCSLFGAGGGEEIKEILADNMVVFSIRGLGGVRFVSKVTQHRGLWYVYGKSFVFDI